MTVEAVRGALSRVVHPDIRKDIVSLGLVKHLEVGDGRVSFVLELPTHSAVTRGQLAEAARAAVDAVDGITEVEVTETVNVKSATAPEHGKPPLPGVKNVVAVGAGKGGVGKTTVAVNLAVALSKMGARVGILDADIYGPNFLTQEENPVIWRGPMLHSAVQQFFRDVGWRDLDYLIVDMPPGTGDVALSLSQTVPVAGAIVVTTPQLVSLADSRRALRMYQKLNIPPLGVVENMSFYECTNCHHQADIFGHGGGEQVAEQLDVPFLGRLPMYQPIRVGSDMGIPLVIAEPESVATRAFLQLAEQTIAQIAIAADRSAVANKGKIPLIQVR
jgi:ATP-binding protein involved in chromosome partitioning